MVKNSPANAGDMSSIPGSGRSPGGGHGHPVPYSCLENPMDRGAWRARVLGLTKSQTRLKRTEHALTGRSDHAYLTPFSQDLGTRTPTPSCFTGCNRPLPCYICALSHLSRVRLCNPTDCSACSTLTGPSSPVQQALVQAMISLVLWFVFEPRVHATSVHLRKHMARVLRASHQHDFVSRSKPNLYCVCFCLKILAYTVELLTFNSSHHLWSLCLSEAHLARVFSEPLVLRILGSVSA